MSGCPPNTSLNPSDRPTDTQFIIGSASSYLDIAARMLCNGSRITLQLFLSLLLLLPHLCEVSAICTARPTILPRFDIPSFMRGGRKPQGSIQLMITKKMKDILMNDLGYYEGEVERMEPEIARVVIEKQLKRPRNGMPPSWDKTNEAKKGLEYRVNGARSLVRRAFSAVSKENALIGGCSLGAAYVMMRLFQNRKSNRYRHRLKSQEQEHFPSSFLLRNSESGPDLKYIDLFQNFSLKDKMKLVADLLKNSFLR